MTKLNKLLKTVSVFLGLTSVGFFIFDFFLFSKLNPRMVRFETISPFEEGLINWVGVGWLIFLIFCLLSLQRIASFLKRAKKITFLSLFLVTSGVLSLVLVFSNVALINDIGKQYRYGLAQPEWQILFPIIAFQLLTAIVFSFFHLWGFKKEDQVKKVARDNNVFLMVQYVGIICGLMGLSLAGLGFLYSRAWSLPIHTTLSSIILLMPYVLVVVYWFLVKFQEKPREWYDEKQRQDVGKSAFLSLVLGVFLMIFLFLANYDHLDGVVSILWLPLYLFSTLLLFSLGNLYFSGKPGG